MEFESSLQCTYQSAISSCPEPCKSNPHVSNYFLNIVFNVILRSMTGSSNVSISFRFRYQNFVCVSVSSYNFFVLFPFTLLDVHSTFFLATAIFQDSSEGVSSQSLPICSAAVRTQYVISRNTGGYQFPS